MRHLGIIVKKRINQYFVDRHHTVLLINHFYQIKSIIELIVYLQSINIFILEQHCLPIIRLHIFALQFHHVFATLVCSIALGLSVDWIVKFGAIIFKALSTFLRHFLNCLNSFLLICDIPEKLILVVHLMDLQILNTLRWIQVNLHFQEKLKQRPD